MWHFASGNLFGYTTSDRSPDLDAILIITLTANLAVLLTLLYMAFKYPGRKMFFQILLQLLCMACAVGGIAAFFYFTE